MYKGEEMSLQKLTCGARHAVFERWTWRYIKQTPVFKGLVQDSCGARCWWLSWLRHCATSRKVAGSIPDGVIGIFYWHNSSNRTMALCSTQPRKWIPGTLPGGEDGRCVGLTNLPPSCADCLGIWEPQPPGTLRACRGLQRDCFSFYNVIVLVGCSGPSTTQVSQ